MKKENLSKEYTISVFSENHIGLLNRITVIFIRRNMNIKSLTVSQSAIEGIHKFTMVVHETEEKIKLIISQIEKLVEVIKAYYYPEEDIVSQEIALYKVPCEAMINGRHIEQLVRNYNARVLEISKEYMIIEKTGHQQETQHLYDKLNEICEVKQFTRSGIIAITKLNTEQLNNYLAGLKEESK